MMDNDYIFQKDYTLVGEEYLDVELAEEDSLMRVEFEETEQLRNTTT